MIRYTLFSRSAMARFSERVRSRKVGNWIERSKVLSLRFVSLREKGKVVVAQMSPTECYVFYLKALKVLKGKSNSEEVFFHKVGDTVKRLFIESWERDGKKGYSISLSVKGGSSVSVACSKEELLALAEWMKELNVLLRYAELERVESEGEEEKGEVQEAVEAEGENVDIEDLDIEDIEF